MACVTGGLAAIKAERIRRAQLLTQSLGEAQIDEGTVQAIATAVRDGDEATIPSHITSPTDGDQGVAIARALQQAGYPAVAADVLADVIAADPSTVVPIDLKALTSSPGFHFAAAKALSDVGLYEKAQEELALGITEDPAAPVPAGVAPPDRRPSWWQEFLDDVGPTSRSVVEIAIIALAAIALMVLLIRTLRPRKPAYVDEFMGGADEHSAGATTAAVQEQFGRLSNQGGGNQLKLVSGSGESTPSLPGELVAAYPSVGVVASLVSYISQLFPDPRGREISGYLRPLDPKRGAGLRLTYARRRGKVFEEITFWESDFGAPLPQGEKEPSQPPYDAIALPAAAWLLFATRNNTFFRKRWQPLEILGTRRWRSYAHFAVGAQAHSEGEAKTARLCYLNALFYDQANIGAQFNLAVAELQLSADA